VSAADLGHEFVAPLPAFPPHSTAVSAQQVTRTAKSVTRPFATQIYLYVLEWFSEH